MKKILLVEDEYFIRDTIKSSLESWGCDVVEAENGVRAYELFEQEVKGTYFAIISDMRMPHMSGLGLCQALNRRYTDVPPTLIHSSDSSYQNEGSTIELVKLKEWFVFVKEVHLKSRDLSYLKQFLDSST